MALPLNYVTLLKNFIGMSHARSFIIGRTIGVVAGV
jgi:hypothetical protein